MKLQIARAALLAAFSVYSSGAIADVISDLPAGHWASISLNTLKDVDPCPLSNCSYSAVGGQSGVTDAWNGGALATRLGARGSMLVFGGGHNDYFGNEVYAFSLDTRLWSRLTDPVVNPVCNQSTGELQNGSPCSRHTYDYLEYHPASNSFVSLGSASNHEVGGGGTPLVNLLDLGTRQWRRGAANFPNFTSGTGSSSAYDPKRDVFWYQAAYNRPFAKYDPNANGGQGSWTTYSDYNQGADGIAAFDSDRDLFVMLDDGVGQVIVRDVNQPSLPPVMVTTVGDKTLQVANSPGFEWDPVTKQFVGWLGGTDVYTLTPPPGNWRTEAWQWRKIAAAAGNTSTPPPPRPAGTFSRWRYAASINAFVLVNGVRDPVFIYKLSAAAGVQAPVVTLTPSSTSVAPGSTVSLTWSATGATQCEATGGWSGARLTAGTANVGPLQASATFTLTCTGSGGIGTAAASLIVSQPTPSPSVSLSADPAVVQLGGVAVLRWTSTNASTCRASTGPWTGTRPTQGSESTSALQGAATFELTCTSSGGDTTRSVTVDVVAPPSVVLTASARSVQAGGNVELSWAAQNASGCAASGAWAGAKAASGRESVGPLSTRSIFEITCTGQGGAKGADVAVDVSALSSPSASASPSPSPSPAPTIQAPSNPGDVAGASGGGGFVSLSTLLLLAGILSINRLSLSGILGGTTPSSRTG